MKTIHILLLAALLLILWGASRKKQPAVTTTTTPPNVATVSDGGVAATNTYVRAPQPAVVAMVAAQPQAQVIANNGVELARS